MRYPLGRCYLIHRCAARGFVVPPTSPRGAPGTIYKKILADEGMKKRDLILAQDSLFSKAIGKPRCLPLKFPSLVASDEVSGFKEDSPEGKA
jgi:hypothetical protein